MKRSARARQRRCGGRRAPRSGDRVLEIVQWCFLTPMESTGTLRQRQGHSHHRRSADFIAIIPPTAAAPACSASTSVANHCGRGCAAGLLLATGQTSWAIPLYAGDGAGRLRGGLHARATNSAAADLVRLDHFRVCRPTGRSRSPADCGSRAVVPRRVACSTR